MSIVLSLLLAMAAAPAEGGRFPLREACDQSSDIVGDLGPADHVTVISSMTLDMVCYLVEANQVRGYLVGVGHPATDAFDRERRQGARELASPPPPKPAATATAEPAPPPTLRPQFPAFSGVDVQGTTFNLASMKGPATLVFFWSSSNAASRKELEVVERIYQRYFKRGLNAIGVTLDGRAEPVLAVLNDVAVSWPQYVDRAGIAKKQGVASVPRLYVLNANREILGVGRAGDLQGVVAELMRPPATAKN